MENQLFIYSEHIWWYNNIIKTNKTSEILPIDGKNLPLKVWEQELCKFDLNGFYHHNNSKIKWYKKNSWSYNYLQPKAIIEIDDLILFKTIKCSQLTIGLPKMINNKINLNIMDESIKCNIVNSVNCVLSAHALSAQI